MLNNILTIPTNEKMFMNETINCNNGKKFKIANHKGKVQQFGRIQKRLNVTLDKNE